MTEQAQAPPLRDSQQQPTRSRSRAQLEQALKRALDAGPAGIEQQLRCVLALSQMIDKPAEEAAHNPAVLSTVQARLVALSHLVAVLDEKQLLTLARDAREIKEVAVRLPLLTRLALHLSPGLYRDIVHEVWNNIQHIEDRALRARTLFELAPLLTLVNDEPATPSTLLDVVGQAQSIKETGARLRSLSALAPHLPYAMSVRTIQRILEDARALNNDAVRSKMITTLAPHLPEQLKGRALSLAQIIEAPAERARALVALAGYLPPEQQENLRRIAMQTIAMIENEEERAELLISFAPYLEYASQEAQFPMLLARALDIAVGIARRHIRARVLVALASHLTLDLQGEALAAVHSLSSERERAMLLATLAPTLPPQMLVASLAVAHTMREQDARVHALSVLAHYVPENARAQTVLDALAAASNLPNHYERVMALVSLLDILPDHLRDQALTNALEAVRLIENENARARALGLVGPHLSDSLLLRSLEIAEQFADPHQRLDALLGIAPRLPGARQQVVALKMLDCVRQMPLEFKQARALTSIAGQVPPEMMSQLQEIAEKFSDPYDRFSVLISMVQNLPHDKRPPLIAQAWRLIKQIEEGYDRASALVAVAPFLPASARPDLAQSISLAIRLTPDDYDKASAISLLGPLLADGDNARFATLPDHLEALKAGMEAALSVPQQALRASLLAEGAKLWVGMQDEERTRSLWADLLMQLHTLPLADVLLCLGALIPIIREMVGEQGLQDVAQILGVR